MKTLDTNNIHFQLPLLKPRLFQRTLLKWFDQHGRKNLPWQQQKTPYRVWLSEIMLQQTQVNTVIPYFQRFIQAFPTVADLAKADEDEVMHLWSGLGYYSRARNLHKAAHMMMQTFAGNIPDTLTDLMQLPGIGQSTAGAILSLGFNKPATILDGNVKRVLSRLHGILKPIDDQRTLEVLWMLADTYHCKARPADHTQAMMDLGAMICVRSKPQCDACPLQQHCIAYREGLTEAIPQKKSTRKIPVRNTNFVIFKHGDHILFEKRPSQGIWGSLWCFPEMSGDAKRARITRFCRSQLNVKPSRCYKMPAFRHTFTHFHLDILPIVVELAKFPCKTVAGQQQIWYKLDDEIKIGLPKPVQRLISSLA